MNTTALLTAASLLWACATQAAPPVRDTDARPSAAGDATATPSEAPSRMKIAVGSKVFSATLRDNAATIAFKAILPLTARMTELNGNEKYVRLAKALPGKAVNPGTIRVGDVMLYGDDTLVLFYKTFPTSYSYTPIARVDDVAGLAAALGADDVTVTFEL
jgi:hypothetical protein